MTDSPDEVIYNHGTYAQLVGSAFELHRPDGEAVSVELVDAKAFPGRGQCFSLVFRGPAGVSLDQRTYRIEHRVLGDFPLFLVPLSVGEDGAQELEAVVNRAES